MMQEWMIKNNGSVPYRLV